MSRVKKLKKEDAPILPTCPKCGQLSGFPCKDMRTGSLTYPISKPKCYLSGIHKERRNLLPKKEKPPKTKDILAVQKWLCS